MRLHLTCILLIAVISMRGDASEIGVSDATTAVPKNATEKAYSMPPEPIVPTNATSNGTTAAPTTPTTTTTTTTNTTTVAPPTTSAPTEPSTPPTTVAPPTTTAAPNTTNTTTVAPASTTSTTTVIPETSTGISVTTERPEASTPSPSEHRHFDGLSFMGGIILACCLVIIGAFTWKFYKDRKDGNYRIL